MRISKEKKKAEALERLRKMNVRPEIIKDFEKDNTVTITDKISKSCCKAFGRFTDMIKSFEKEHDALVYLAMYTETEMDIFTTFRMLSLLFVSDYVEDWPYEKEDIPAGIIFTYTINLDDDHLSEMGSVGFRMVNGMPMRAY